MLRQVTHNYKQYINNFVEGLYPLMSEAHCGYTSLQEYVITINPILQAFAINLSLLILLKIFTVLLPNGPTFSDIYQTSKQKRQCLETKIFFGQSNLNLFSCCIVKQNIRPAL